MLTDGASCCAIGEAFDRRIADREIERYRKKGARASTRLLLDAIRAGGASGATVLDVGGGIGTIAHELVAAGAERATVVDGSAAFLAAAREEAERRGTAPHLQLVHGDFVALAAGLARADVVTLDKVVCCYPDMAHLLATSTAHAVRLYGIVYPRDAWWLRLVTGMQNAFWRYRKSAFRMYVFPNAAIDESIRNAGLALRTQKRGMVWVMALYERSAAG